MDSFSRYKIETFEIDFEDRTDKFISTNLPIEIINEYYGYKPYIKSISDLPAEIQEKDTVAVRLKITLIDDLEFINPGVDLSMASYWRLWIARNRNYEHRLVRYYIRIGDGDLIQKFVGVIDNLSVDSMGTVVIECVDLLNAMSKIDYPFLTGIRLAEDMPAIYPIQYKTDCLNLTDAVAGDLAKVTTFELNLGLIENYTSPLSNGNYYFQVVAYKDDLPIASTEIKDHRITAAHYLDVTFRLVPVCDYYLVFLLYWIDDTDPENIIQHDVNKSVQVIWQNSFDSETYYESWIFTEISGDDLTPPAAADCLHYYELIEDGVYYHINDWEFLANYDFGINVEGSTLLLDNSGFIKIGEEIISYTNIISDSEGISLTGIERGLYSTDPIRHSVDTALYYILSVPTLINAYAQLKKLLNLGGIDNMYISSKYDDYESLDDLDVSTLPIIKSNKLSNIFFDLVNIADCLAFPNDSGEIDILKRNEFPDDYEQLNDESNFIYNSTSIDLNKDSRFTRWILYWSRFDLSKSWDDPNSYGLGNITIDDEAETYYGDVISDTQFTTWLNATSQDEIDLINIYINDLLNRRRIRQNTAQNIFTADLEIKDNNLSLGQLVKIQTSKILDENGDQPNEIHRIIKKDPGFNKINFKFQRIRSYMDEDIKNLNSVSDLGLWFPDWNLKNPASNQFTWLDEISQTILISGTFGNGSGLEQINEHNVLNTYNGADSNINSNFLDVADFTFIGIIHQNYPISADLPYCHNITQVGYGDGNARNINLGYNTINGSVPYEPAGLRIRVSNGFNQLNKGTSGLYDPNIVPYVPTFIIYKFSSTAGTIQLYVNDQYFSGEVSISKLPFNVYKLVGTGSQKFYGKIFEFMYYFKLLDLDEINYICNLLSIKYKLDWNTLS